jgi:magnesium-transporting ATPase (P-type)
LLDAAKEVGYMFSKKNSNSITVEIFGQKVKYDLLYKIEFTSERKMMSVICRDPATGCIVLFSKGADLVIFKKLDKN